MAEEGYKRLPTDGTASMVEIPQYGMQVMLAVWAAAALPMALLAWLVAPALADRLTGVRVLKHLRGWLRPSDHVPVTATLEL